MFILSIHLFLNIENVPLVWTWTTFHGPSGRTLGSSLPLLMCLFRMRTSLFSLESKNFPLEFSLILAWSTNFCFCSSNWFQSTCLEKGHIMCLPNASSPGEILYWLLTVALIANWGAAHLSWIRVLTSSNEVGGFSYRLIERMVKSLYYCIWLRILDSG